MRGHRPLRRANFHETDPSRWADSPNSHGVRLCRNRPETNDRPGSVWVQLPAISAANPPGRIQADAASGGCPIMSHTHSHGQCHFRWRNRPVLWALAVFLKQRSRALAAYAGLSRRPPVCYRRPLPVPACLLRSEATRHVKGLGCTLKIRVCAHGCCRDEMISLTDSARRVSPTDPAAGPLWLPIAEEPPPGRASTSAGMNEHEHEHENRA